ncbi:ABC transporter substrate-binding protein [Nocardiopsis prasina]|uniref:ABC transporter substrate-binding protein n=1 Tax=Nocardiopsis prasina TaxID=2015 RepID=UPI0003494B79|nr:ABC transporter substrate-binding protein [Nocardiopsis prasina]
MSARTSRHGGHRTHRTRILGGAAAALGLTLAATACGGGSTTASGADLDGQTLEVVGPWAGDEQVAFEQVVSIFEKQTGATVSYSGAGDDLQTVLQTRIQGGDEPDVALIPQAGLIEHFAAEDVLVPLTDDVVQTVDENMAGAWADIGSVGDTPYGVYLKVANKSLVWYNDDLFAETGAAPPENWEEFVELSDNLSDVGISPLSVAGADGWVLTDWFENVYLQTAGPEMYDQLATHEIPWTDPSVEVALETLAEVWGQEQLMLGGGSGSLQTDFPTSVVNVYSDDPDAAMVVGADFIGGVVSASTNSVVGETAQVFPFPSIAGEGDAVVVAGDAAVAMSDSEATMELLRFLASEEAAAEWASIGGFLSPNMHLTADDYADPVLGQVAEQIIDAGDSVRFDLSDLQPAAFGATVGDGMWQTLQDFLADPSDVEGTMERLEAEAARAHGN